MARPLPPGPLPSGRASVKAICDVIAEVNHFLPYRRHSPFASCAARVNDAPTSEPPVDSVIHCPLVQARSGSRLVSRGTACSISFALPATLRVRAAPSVIANGQV